MVYEPSDDTYLMNDALKYFDLVHGLKFKKVLEIGSGNAYNSIFCYNCGSETYSLDIDSKAIEYGEKLAGDNNYKITFIQSDMFSNLSEKNFDLIFFNPPYLASDTIEHIDLDGLENGRHFIDLFIDDFDAYLSKRGRVLLLHTDYNDLKLTKSRLNSKGFDFNILATKKLFFEELHILDIFRI